MRRRSRLIVLCLSLGAVTVSSAAALAHPTRSATSGVAQAAGHPDAMSSSSHPCTFSPIASSAPVAIGRNWILLGEHDVEPGVGRNPALAFAQAFPFRSRITGRVSSIEVYVASHNQATGVMVAVYSNASCLAGSRLTVGSLRGPKSGAGMPPQSMAPPSDPVGCIGLSCSDRAAGFASATAASSSASVSPGTEFDRFRFRLGGRRPAERMRGSSLCRGHGGQASRVRTRSHRRRRYSSDHGREREPGPRP